MIEVLTAILMVLMDIFMIVVLFCAILLALTVLDYLLDTEIKRDLNKALGERKWLKDIRTKLLNLFKKIDDDEFRKEAL